MEYGIWSPYNLSATSKQGRPATRIRKISLFLLGLEVETVSAIGWFREK
jgi:hypothetical protein